VIDGPVYDQGAHTTGQSVTQDATTVTDLELHISVLFADIFDVNGVRVGFSTVTATVAGATYTVESNQNGAFSIYDIPVGSVVTVSVSRPGFTTVTHSRTYTIYGDGFSTGGDRIYFNESVQDVLQTMIDDANTLLGAHAVGTASGNVSQAAHDAFAAVIAQAIYVKANPAPYLQLTDLSPQLSALVDATAAFNNAIID
ncbi:MAG: hypothetical protein J7559_20065, partial [Cohnella sp.]|nr:hypothetical protein [Cohnella sp.]